jgi:Bacterial Ig-like domain (group 3)/FG-GAP repeat
VAYPSGGEYAGFLVAADVNGDGRPDVLVANVCDFPSCDSGTVSVLLNKEPTTKTTVTSSGSPSFVGQAVTFMATVTSRYGAIPDGELVTFYDDGVVIGTGLITGGIATSMTSSLTVKTHSIKAVYIGDANFKSSFGGLTQVVKKYPTTTTLSSTLNPTAAGQSVTFTATVASTGSSMPTRKVLFKDGTKSIGTESLSGGVATLTKSTLATGSHAITAEYEGDAASAKSTSAILTQVVN